jgi:3-hydroxy-5-methyl-1-naphthoate 3-O-methyltransferase
VVSPVPLMQLSTDFWAFKTLAAAHELDLFTRLSRGEGMTIEEVARDYAIEKRRKNSA